MPWIICFKLSKMHTTQLFCPSLYRSLNIFYLHGAPVRKYVKTIFLILLPVKVAQILFLCYFLIQILLVFCLSVVKNGYCFVMKHIFQKTIEIDYIWGFFLSNQRVGVTFSAVFCKKYGCFLEIWKLSWPTWNWGIVKFWFLSTSEKLPFSSASVQTRITSKWTTSGTK